MHVNCTMMIQEYHNDDFSVFVQDMSMHVPWL